MFFILFEQSVYIISADCFISGFTASQSTLFCEAKYSVLHFAQYSKFCSAFASKVFLYDIHRKTLLKIQFQLVSNFIFLPPSFSFLRHFCSYESTKDKLFLYHIWTLVRRFVGVFRKSFLLPHYNWKVTSRLLGYFTKILQKNCREIFPTTAYKKEVRYNSNFLFRFY